VSTPPVYVASPPRAIAPSYAERWYIDCPSYYDIVGGGFEPAAGSLTGTTMQSGPDSIRSGWRVAVRNTGDSLIYVRGWAVCVPDQ
jgi:hypothetical protein